MSKITNIIAYSDKKEIVNPFGMHVKIFIDYFWMHLLCEDTGVENPTVNYCYIN